MSLGSVWIVNHPPFHLCVVRFPLRPCVHPYMHVWHCVCCRTQGSRLRRPRAAQQSWSQAWCSWCPWSVQPSFPRRPWRSVHTPSLPYSHSIYSASLFFLILSTSVLFPSIELSTSSKAYFSLSVSLSLPRLYWCCTCLRPLSCGTLRPPLKPSGTSGTRTWFSSGGFSVQR
jgi:hypothetical protein